MLIYVERTILSLPKVYINGGRRGYLVGIDPRELVRVLKAVEVDVGLEG
jgi:prolyl-tRNA editing enzyme YbaK/EbsC (Cys-tRNA(Pro) deacylase)